MKKFVLIFVALSLFHHSGYSQNKYQEQIDSLLAELAKATQDSIKLNLFVAIMSEHLYYKPEEGLTYQKAALELSEKVQWKLGTARIKDNIGSLNLRTGNFAEALKNHFEALDIYSQIGSKYEEGKMLILIGQDYVNNGKYEEGKKYLLKGLKLAEDAGDKINMAAAYDILIYSYNVQGNIAEASKTIYLFLKMAEQIGSKGGMAHATSLLASNFQTLGNSDEAIKYFGKALQLVKEAGDKIEETYINSYIGDLYTSLGNFPEAKNYYSAALRLAENIGSARILIGDVRRGMGNLYLAEGNYTEALNNYLIAADEYKAVSNNQPLASLYSEIGIIYTHFNKYELARKSLNDARSLGKELNSTVSMGDYYRGLQMLDSATGNWKDAYQHHKQYIVFKDSTFNKETLRKMVTSQMQYENDKKEAIAKAEQEKKDLRAQEELIRQRNIRNSTFAVLALVLLFSIVAYRQRNKIAKEKKRSDQLLMDKELLLREIHHRVKNNLEVVSSLLELQSSQIDDPNTKEAMREGQNRVHSIGIVHQKLYIGENPGAIEMKDYFINLSKSILDSFGAEGRVNVELAMEKLNVDIDTAVPLGLIVNELITNTIKYAFPGNQHGSVCIKLEKQTGGLLRLEVSDNGIGKSGITQGTGFGGQLISLLTRQLNGTMKEENKNGTRIIFDFNCIK